MRLALVAGLSKHRVKITREVMPFGIRLEQIELDAKQAALGIEQRLHRRDQIEVSDLSFAVLSLEEAVVLVRLLRDLPLGGKPRPQQTQPLTERLELGPDGENLRVERGIEDVA